MAYIKVIDTNIKEVKIIEPKVFKDERGLFFESFNLFEFESKIDSFSAMDKFVQDNQSISKSNVLRGIHYQIKYPQGKLVRCLSGSILDVAIDLRKNSKTFKESVIVELSSKNKKQLWIPEGFGHAFAVLGDTPASIMYKCTVKYFQELDRCIIWNDPTLNIPWKQYLDIDKVILSEKDKHGQLLRQADLFTL